MTPEVPVHGTRAALERRGYVYERTGAGPLGWRMVPGLWYRCTACGGLVPAEPDRPPFACACGAMRKDPDAFRFGSSLGDEAIEVYRRAGGARRI